MRSLLKCKKFEVVSIEVPARSGGNHSYEVIYHPGAVVILPLLDASTVLLIRNKRYSINETLWELPAGTLERDEVPQSAAARELEEECGYRAETIEPLLSFYSSPGICNEKLSVFVATGLTKTQQCLDETESIEVVATPLERVRAMVRDGQIQDAKTIASLLYYVTFSK